MTLSPSCVAADAGKQPLTGRHYSGIVFKVWRARHPPRQGAPGSFRTTSQERPPVTWGANSRSSSVFDAARHHAVSTRYRSGTSQAGGSHRRGNDTTGWAAGIAAPTPCAMTAGRARNADELSRPGKLGDQGSLMQQPKALGYGQNQRLCLIPCCPWDNGGSQACSQQHLEQQSLISLSRTVSLRASAAHRIQTPGKVPAARDDNRWVLQVITSLHALYWRRKWEHMQTPPRAHGLLQET
jgi:hypothetical protein